MQKISRFAKDVDLPSFAKRTPGFTGADLANVLNEAALFGCQTRAKSYKEFRY